MLTMHNEKHIVNGFEAIGLTHFLQKNQEIDEIVHAIKGTSDEGSSQKDSAASFLISNAYGVPKIRIDEKKLSEREIEIIRLISKEMTNKQIAEQLCLSTRTIDGHKERIQQKIKAKNSIGIVMYALKHNLLTD